MTKTGMVAKAAAMIGVPMLLALSACGSDTPEDDAGESAPPSFASFEEYQLAFAECMRGQGVEVDDPGSDGMNITAADEAFMEAADACQGELGAPPAPEGAEGSGEDLRAEHLEIAECMREHGVDVVDPAPGENLDVPADVPVEVMETCAPEGVFGSTGVGQ